MAMVSYSECLRIGKGTPQNYERGGHNYRMATDLGNKEGIFPMHLWGKNAMELKKML